MTWQWPWHNDEWIPPDRELRRRLTHLAAQNDRILHKLDRAQEQETRMSTNLEAITSAVESNTTVDESAIVLLNQIAGQLEAFKNDPIEIQALADQLNGESQKLAAAVAANTPAEADTPPPVDNPPAVEPPPADQTGNTDAPADNPQVSPVDLP